MSKLVSTEEAAGFESAELEAPRDAARQFAAEFFGTLILVATIVCTGVHSCVTVYLCISIYLHMCASLRVSIYLYVCVCVFVYVKTLAKQLNGITT